MCIRDRLKETSVAGYIAVRDLTKAADGVRGITFNSVPLLSLIHISSGTG